MHQHEANWKLQIAQINWPRVVSNLLNSLYISHKSVIGNIDCKKASDILFVYRMLIILIAQENNRKTKSRGNNSDTLEKLIDKRDEDLYNSKKKLFVTYLPLAGKGELEHWKKDWQLRGWLLLQGAKRSQKKMLWRMFDSLVIFLWRTQSCILMTADRILCSVWRSVFYSDFWMTFLWYVFAVDYYFIHIVKFVAVMSILFHHSSKLKKYKFLSIAIFLFSRKRIFLSNSCICSLGEAELWVSGEGRLSSCICLLSLIEWWSPLLQEMGFLWSALWSRSELLS